MAPLFARTQNLAFPLLRIAMGVILLWIGGLKFLDPSPVVGLLGASLPFLAFPAFVYLLGVAEVVLALMLLAGFQVKYAGLGLLGLFAASISLTAMASAEEANRQPLPAAARQRLA